jgi:hypothetical protein
LSITPTGKSRSTPTHVLRTHQVSRCDGGVEHHPPYYVR